MLNKPEFREVPHEKGYPDSQQRIERDEAIDFNEGLKAGLAYYEQELGKEWISVEDRLPEIGVPVLVIHDREVKVGVRVWEHPTFEDNFESFWFWDCAYDDGKGWENEDVTHWQPLPKPPKGEV